ncbi:OprD family porin [Atopomonas hussainii]|uniref:OprD family porin n=1 Tax=Atopomonas hussainii TaxID=1429083 RepID=UPI0008FFE99E|nr:OprD family porin [Atopomonas hussainii]
MQMIKWSAIAVAVAAATSSVAMANQADSKGFVEDSSLNLFTRALYMNRDFRNGDGNIKDSSKASGYKSGYREETGLGVRVLFESGFTQGTVGVGFDAHSLSSIKFDSGKGRTGNGMFSTNADGEPEDTQSEIGGAIKFRVSDTVLKHGNMMVDTPVFSTDDSRILPEVATGTLLTSDEIAGLTLTAGRFTAISSQTATGRDSNTSEDADGNVHTLEEANILGANYSFNDNFSGAVFFSDVEDHFKKRYLNLNYSQELAEGQAFGIDFNFYRTTDDGAKKSGAIDNKIYSIAPSYTLGAHKFTVGYQQSSGETGYGYGIDGNGTIYLANSVQYSDFNSADERSYQARYDLNMASYGVPGLSFMTRYVTGRDIDVGGGQEGKEHEWDFETKYVLQEGAAKDLSFRLRSAIYRANSDVAKDVNDFRLIVEYPLSIL